MSCGVPVFTTPQGILGLDHVKPQEDIFVADEGKIVALINGMVFNSEAMEKARKSAIQCIRNHYGKEQNAARLASIIDGLSESTI
jgi:glycosyltransferase involved in cell wall biosynthesis